MNHYDDFDTIKLVAYWDYRWILRIQYLQLLLLQTPPHQDRSRERAQRQLDDLQWHHQTLQT